MEIKNHLSRRTTFSGKLVLLSTTMLLVDSHLLTMIGRLSWVESEVGKRSVQAVSTMLQVLVHLGNSWAAFSTPGGGGPSPVGVWHDDDDDCVLLICLHKIAATDCFHSFVRNKYFFLSTRPLQPAV